MYKLPNASPAGTFTTTVDGKEVTLKRPYTFARWTFVIDRAGKVIHKDTSVNASADSGNVADLLKAAMQASSGQ